MLSVIKLIIATLLPVMVAIILDLLEKKGVTTKIKYPVKQTMYGVIFGAIAIVGTEWGIPMHNAMVNCRDAAPMVAGLFFGGPAGIIAGIIGGVERWIAVAWGVGSFTRFACSISTVLAGVFVAVLRKVMFEGKRPVWFMGLFFGVSIEVFHLMMVFLTNADNAERAINVVRACTVPMVIANGAAVALTSVALYLMSADRHMHRNKTKTKPMFETIQNGLLVVVLVAFVAVSGFMILLEANLAKSQMDNQFKTAIEEASSDVVDASGAFQIDLTKIIAANIEEGEHDLKKLANIYGVEEICIVDKNGIIVECSDEEYIGFDMASGEQSAEFLCLLNGEQEYVQEYGPIAADKNVFMKYAGVAFGEGFLQTGYNAQQFQEGLNSEVTFAIHNRHVGERGFFVVLDEKDQIVSLSTNYPDDGSFPLEMVDFSNLVSDKMTRINLDGKNFFYIRSSVEGYEIVGFCALEDAMMTGIISIYVSVFNMIILFSLLFVNLYILIKKKVVNQIVSMAKSLDRISAGNLDEVVSVRSNAEFASLSDDINMTVSTLKRYIKEAASRIDAELEFARTIQSSALPSHFPAFPNRTEFDIYARMDTAKEVGGDFYDFYFTDIDTMTFAIADVSGKGIPAAMFMMRSKSELRGSAEKGLSINDVFSATNNMLCQGNDDNMFVTAWQGSINIKTGEMNFANAGHNPPVLKRKDGKFEYLKVKPNLVLASMEGIKYARHELQLFPGDILFLYTDGVTEATNAQNELYGDDRLIDILNSKDFENMQDICDTVKADVDKFVDEAPQFDDMTMVAYIYKGYEVE